KDALFTPRVAEGRRYDAIARGRERLQESLQRTGFALVFAAGLTFLLSLRASKGALAGWPAALAFAFTAVELGLLGAQLNRGQPLPHAHDSEVHAFLREQRDAAADRGGFMVARGAGAAGPYNLPG